ncbi:ATP-dependent DNA ligase [Nakamurella flava]|uniref:DNA ligase n=1 Tax=Nakamurella flava TaxID=2576308 RepID=A0A4U6QNL5_9ACTN|nr:ATP-dependent DNA ligase [Nakamurella flava]TKV61788.1 ATP-dependent DNA ligase [Nakamurella flava]
MQLQTLVQTWRELSATRSRIAKRDRLAAVIGAAEPAEIALVVTYLSGTLRQRRTGVGWAALSDVPDPAVEPSLTVAEVDAAFAAMAELAGSGSVARRAAAVAELWGRATADEQGFLRGLAFDELRQGALVALVQDGLAQAFTVPVAAVQRASMLLGSTPAAAELLATQGLPGLESVRLTVGIPISPMLAAAAPDPAAALDKVGRPAFADVKLDGIRVQVHHGPHGTRVFSRSLDDITDRVPGIVAAVAGLGVDTAVLDGEAIASGPDGRPLAFQEISSRAATRAAGRGSRTAAAPAVDEVENHLQLRCFDVLHLDGRDLLDEPLTVRAEIAEQLLPPALRVDRHLLPDGVDDAESLAELERVFRGAVADGFEGLVVKRAAAGYAAGRRDAGWVKVKPRHTLDLAVIAAEWGYGRRQGWLSNIHLAARDADTGELVMLGKTFKGMTDAMLAWQTEQFQAREVRRTRSTVFVDPPLVAEIAIDGLQRSTRYPGGVALRFARVLRYRDDKTPDEVDTLQTVRAIGGPLLAADG